MIGQGWRTTMRSKELLIACAMVLVSLVPATAGGPDLSAFGTPVDQTVPAAPAPPTWKEPANKHWPAHICAEIQRVEGIAVGGPLRPSDRGIARFGLLLLEQGHCGIDVSRKVAADQAVLDEEQRRAPPRPLNCFTTRLGGGMSTTTCR
jgi:hypothetical protein